MSLINRLGNRDKTEPYKQNREPNQTVEFSTIPIPTNHAFFKTTIYRKNHNLQMTSDNLKQKIKAWFDH